MPLPCRLARSPGFAAKFVSGKTVDPCFERTLEEAERVGWMRIVPPADRPPTEVDALCRQVAAVLARAGCVDLKVHPSDASGARDSLHAVGAVTISRATNKSIGLAVVARHLGLSPSSIVAFGDATNDLEMFEWAGRSICPANGSADAKAAATYCSPRSNDEDFIAHELQSGNALGVDGLVGSSSQAEPPAKRRKALKIDVDGVDAAGDGESSP